MEIWGEGTRSIKMKYQRIDSSIYSFSLDEEKWVLNLSTRDPRFHVLATSCITNVGQDVARTCNSVFSVLLGDVFLCVSKQRPV